MSEREKPQFSPRPLSERTIIRLLFFFLLVSLFFAGYYQTRWQLEVKRYNRLEDLFVRVRGQLGREETQRLIDESYLTSEQNLP